MTENDARILVEMDALDLDVMFDDVANNYASIWERDGDPVASFEHEYIPGDEDSRDDVLLFVETATVLGLTAYRWVTEDGTDASECGPVVLSRTEAEADAQEMAASQVP